MRQKRFLNKSRFALAIDCATKLFYTKKDTYPDKSSTGEFLKSLTEGGFQVGELARCYYPGGVMIEDMNYNSSVSKTNDLLKNKNVTIFGKGFLSYKELEKRRHGEDIGFLSQYGIVVWGKKPYDYSKFVRIK